MCRSNLCLPIGQGIFAGLLFFVGCGPVYDTQVTFVPPAPASGKTCVTECENKKLSCEQSEELRNERCQDRAERNYERCRDRGDKYCYEETCSPDYRRCEETYKSCFQACGGRIENRQVCVSSCDEASDETAVKSK